MTTVRLCEGVAVLAAVVMAGCGADPPPAAVSAVASAGGGHPRGLVTGFAEGVALAGDAALIGRVGKGGVSVTRVPLAGTGGPPTTLPWPDRPTGGLRVLSMDASPDVLGLTVTTGDDEQAQLVSGLFGGSPTGPVSQLEPVRVAGPGVRIPRSVQVDGELLFVGVSDGQSTDAGQFTLRTAGVPPRSIDLPAGAEITTFAGDLVAYAEAPPAPPAGARAGDFDSVLPHRIVVRDWRTGVQRTSFSVRRGIASLAISGAGAVAVGESRGGVVELRPGRPLRRIARSRPPPWPGAAPVYAGERLVIVRRERAFGPEQLVISEPEGRMRTFGVPSLAIGVLAADERRVLWGSGGFPNGCVVVADLQAPAARAVAAGGPCARTAIDLEQSGATQGQRSTLRSGRRVGVTLECVAAPPPGCRGVLRMTMDGTRIAAAPVRFKVAPGRSRRLVVRLTPAARAQVVQRRVSSFTLTASAVDPNGRRSQHGAELTVER